MDDRNVVARQLGRQPRGQWRVATRCSFGYPQVIATAPETPEGEPFPTLYYLTCPHLVAEVSRLESAGKIDRWRWAIAADETLAAALLEADACYRTLRAAEGGGEDPTSGVGIGGTRDVRAVKCLHAHVAAALAGIADPVGEGTLAAVERECSDRRCGEDE